MLGKENHRIIPREYDIFGGIDVDKRSLVVTFTDHEHLEKSVHMPNKAENLLHFVHNHFPKKKVAFVYEAGPTGYGLYDMLNDHGLKCLVVSPCMVPTAPGARVKTNRLDSLKLSLALRGGQLHGIRVPSEPYRHLRHFIKLRDVYVRQIVAFKNRIKAMLLFEGIEFPGPADGSAARQWSKKVIAKLEQLPCEAPLRFKLDHLLRSLASSKSQALQIQREIRRYCRKNPELARCIRFLMSIPGIGWIVASHFLARVGDWRLFGNSRQISGFMGLVPCERSTGDDVAKGPITGIGDSRLRNKLIQAAWSSIFTDPEMREFYERIYQRHPKDRAPRKAIVAVANKLCRRAFAVLKEQRPYVVRRLAVAA
jgi:transposase